MRERAAIVTWSAFAAPRRLVSACCLLALVGCASVASDVGPVDPRGQPTPDLSSLPPDLAARTDLATRPPDLASAPPDLSAVVPDLSAPSANLSARPADLSAPPADLSAPQPDLAKPAPDLATVADLATTPDLARCAIQGCATGNESADGCGHARTIGRKPASAPGGTNFYNFNCYLNRWKTAVGSCQEGASDDTYRIFLRANEKLKLSLSTQSDCNMNGFQFSATLAVYASTGGCGAVACGGAPLQCQQGSGNPAFTFVAPADGWYLVVVDGSSSFDTGYYYLYATLTGCAQANCECP